jgi:hypothetical protein
MVYFEVAKRFAIGLKAILFFASGWSILYSKFAINSGLAYLCRRVHVT